LSTYRLTAKEEEIVLWVIRGLSNQQIADQLCVCEQTVKDHLHDVFKKVHVHRRSELVAKLLGLGAHMMER
jgi:DNA-binding CsgD family transcriptional regulator